jgi:hypothetical protein
MKEIAHRLALLSGMGTASAVAVVTWFRGVGPLQQSFRAVVCGLAVYLAVRLALGVVGEMLLSRLLARRAEEERQQMEDLKKAAQAVEAAGEGPEEETPAA